MDRPLYRDDWLRRQRLYWDLVAEGYESLYADGWSALENLHVQQRLSQHLPANCSLLDLGCGTGLTYHLASASTSVGTYWGIDVSPEMIAIAQGRIPEGHFLQGDMSDLSSVPGLRFDGIVALFASLSYASDPATALMSAYQLLRPGGVLFVSVLGRLSLRRLVRGRRGIRETYGTRGFGGPPAAEAWTYTPEEARLLVARCGYVLDRAWGLGAFAGVSQHTCLWTVSRLLDRVAPRLAHIVYVEATRPDETNDH